MLSTLGPNPVTAEGMSSLIAGWVVEYHQPAASSLMVLLKFNGEKKKKKILSDAPSERREIDWSITGIVFGILLFIFFL